MASGDELGRNKVASPAWIKGLRARLGLTQKELADKLQVTFVTVSRWENGQSFPNRIAVKALSDLAKITNDLPGAPKPVGQNHASYEVDVEPPTIDFRADPELVRLFVEGERLRYGHLFSPVFGSETALIDPLPHQIIAVYRCMLPQPRLRLLLADDAGAGKTIMTGLYMREMLDRHLLRRVLIVPPAGLVGNWIRELRTLFSLHLREISGPDCREENPFTGPGSDLAVVSVDTLTGKHAFDRLSDVSTPPYDLVVFDEAHKLSAFRNSDGTYETTDRYKLAEFLAGAEQLQATRPPRRLGWHAHHLLLLTATPHMGKPFPYYALWRLLEPGMLRTEEAFKAFPAEARTPHFIRRTKEEMVKLDGSPIYPTRVSQTSSYDLTNLEWDLYQQVTDYVRFHYNKAQTLNRSAARLAMSVLQRRAASSTYALLRSLQRRLDKIDEFISKIVLAELTEKEFQAQQLKLRLVNVEDERTTDDEAGEDGKEQRDAEEDKAMSATTAASLGELQAEKEQVRALLGLAERVHASHEESKFDRLCDVLRDPRFRHEKLLIFTEHRDTMDFLVQRLEGLGYTGQIASIHGGMPYPERERQMDEFRHHRQLMVATDAAGEGINLQFCWIMINYDIPWNPARIEQRFGRIHRYKQEHDPVILVNLVANKTREGKVLSTLLEKLESIREELGSDKVFDVIGRQFFDVSLTEIIMRAVTGEGDDEASIIAGMLTAEQVQARRAQAEAALDVQHGDILSLLPSLRDQMQQEQLYRLLPGYVRSYVVGSAAHLGIRLSGDLEGEFSMHSLPLSLALAMEESMEDPPKALSFHRPKDDSGVLWLRPGNDFFDRYRALFRDRFASSVLRGGAFIDPYCTEPYLYHLAIFSVVRQADPQFPDAYAFQSTRDLRLVAIKQPLEGDPRPCPVELLMLLQPVRSLLPTALPSQQTIDQALSRAKAYVNDDIARPLLLHHRESLQETIAAREAYLKQGFDFQDADLADVRARLRESAQLGDQNAKRRFEEVCTRQRQIKALEKRAVAILRREPDLLELGPITFLAHALVLPSSDPEDRERHDKQVEEIAMKVAWAYEEARGAAVWDVSTPEKAAMAGLEKWPGFDLLSRMPGGEQRSIEVKGRRGVGDIEVKQNEWAKSANLRDGYWLYVVYDCASLQPRLLRIQDPFGKLLVREKGGVIVGEGSIFEAAEE